LRLFCTKNILLKHLTRSPEPSYNSECYAHCDLNLVNLNKEVNMDVIQIPSEFVGFMAQINQATQGQSNKPYALSEKTVRGIKSNKEAQDAYEATEARINASTAKLAKMSGTDGVGVYSNRGETALDAMKKLGGSIDISV
jgi:uncharacterized protein YlxW (UPF0749 family)